MPAAKKRPAASAVPGETAAVSAKRIRQKALVPLSDPTVTILKTMIARLPDDDRKCIDSNLKKIKYFPMAGGCSGSNVAAVTAQILFHLLGHDEALRDLFACEKDFGLIVYCLPPS